MILDLFLPRRGVLQQTAMSLVERAHLCRNVNDVAAIMALCSNCGDAAAFSPQNASVPAPSSAPRVLAPRRSVNSMSDLCSGVWQRVVFNLRVSVSRAQSVVICRAGAVP